MRNIAQGDATMHMKAEAIRMIIAVVCTPDERVSGWLSNDREGRNAIVFDSDFNASGCIFVSRVLSYYVPTMKCLRFRAHPVA